MKLDFSCRLAAFWCACGLLLAGCVAEPAVQLSDESGRLDRSLYQAAESFEKRRDYATAVSYYRNLYRRDQTDIGAIVGLSRGLRHLRQAREAQAIVARAMKEAPKDPDLRVELGKVQLALGEPLKAIDSLSRVDSEINSERWDIKIAMAIAYDRLGMYEQAERRYQQALKLSPENAIVMNNFALSLAQAGRLPEAVDILERAAAMPEATPRMRQNLALLYAMRGDLRLAEQYVRRDMPPNIADQNMAYYRQLRAGMATGDKVAAPPHGRLAAPAPNTALPPAEVVALEPAPAEKPAAPTAPAAMTKMAAAPPKAAKEETVQPKMATTEKTVMAAPAQETAPNKVVAAAAPEENPAPEAKEKSEPAPERKPAVKMADKDESLSEVKAAPMPKAGEQHAMPARTAPEAAVTSAASATQPIESPKVSDPVENAVTAEAEAADQAKVAAARADEAPPSPESKIADAGAKAPESMVASAAVKGYRLQLGSFRSMDGAEKLRARLMKEHLDLLQDLDLVVETVSVPNRGDFFRVNSRPVPDREMVDETCLRLAIRDVPCLLVNVP
jgi:Flp pilus assembly protein TadD